MSHPIAISLSPNAESDDVRRAWYALTHKSIWQDTKWPLQAERLLQKHFPHAALTSSGRQALFRLLKAFNIGPGDEVIVQAFTCIAVPAPVLWVGATPIYADIDKSTYNLDVESVRRKLTPNTRAIIVQHTFGILGPVTELKQVADDNDIVLIEDFAHGLQPLTGDAAILSFGRDKLISSVFGGAVVSGDRQLVERIREQQRALPLPPDKWVRQQLLHPFALDLIVPWYFRLCLGKAWLVMLQKLGLLSKAYESAERAGGQPSHLAWRFSPALAYLLVNQLEKLERFQKRRREIVARYNQAFQQSTPAQLRYPLRRPSTRAGVATGDWYNAPLVPADCDLSQFKYHPGDCPVAESVSRDIINLPTYPKMTDEQVEEVIRQVA